LKYNWMKLLPFEKNVDIRKLWKNDHYVYIYVVGSEGSCVKKL